MAVGTAGGTPKPDTIGITSVFARDRSPGAGGFGASPTSANVIAPLLGFESSAVVADDESPADAEAFEESPVAFVVSPVDAAAFDESLADAAAGSPVAAFDESVVAAFEESLVVAFEESVAEPVVAPALPAAFEASPVGPAETSLASGLAPSGVFFDSSFVTGPAASSSISAPVFIRRAYATGLGRSIFEIFELAGGFRLMAFIGASVRACGQV